jgi:hypothetical protein
MDASNPIETTNFSGRGSSNVIFSTIHEEKHFTEEAFTKEPMNFNDYLNLKE